MIPAGIFRNIGRAGASRLLRNRTAMGAITGGMYGAFSNNTSIVGGALMGAAAGRYLGAGFLSGAYSGKGLGFNASLRAYGRAFGRGVTNMARRDFRTIMANRGMNRIRSSLKGWM